MVFIPNVSHFANVPLRDGHSLFASLSRRSPATGGDGESLRTPAFSALRRNTSSLTSHCSPAPASAKAALQTLPHKEKQKSPPLLSIPKIQGAKKLSVVEFDESAALVWDRIASAVEEIRCKKHPPTAGSSPPTRSRTVLSAGYSRA